MAKKMMGEKRGLREGGNEESHGSLREGGDSESSGMLYDNSNKRQHHEPPMGHGEVLAKARSYGNDYSSEQGPSAKKNIGHEAALSKAKEIGGSMSSETGADEQTYERQGAGEMAYEKAKGPKNEPNGGYKASGYRMNKKGKK